MMRKFFILTTSIIAQALVVSCTVRKSHSKTESQGLPVGLSAIMDHLYEDPIKLCLMPSESTRADPEWGMIVYAFEKWAQPLRLLDPALKLHPVRNCDE